METNDQKPEDNKTNQPAPQAEGNDQNTGNSLRDFPKENLLDMKKGAEAMDKFGGHPEPIEGRSISGAGSGPGTGDGGGDFDRPGSPEDAPAKNDYVEHQLPPDDVSGTTNDYREVDGSLHYEKRKRSSDDTERANDSAYLPGSGAVRTAEDRIPPAKSESDEE